MKPHIILFFLLAPYSIFSQKLVRQSINTLGYSSQINNNEIHLSQTAGQSSLNTVFSTANFILRQGFQQPESLDILSASDVTILIYPNPNHGNFNVITGIPHYQSYSLTFSDETGKVLMEKKCIGSRQETIYFPNNIEPGVYYCQLTTEKGSVTSSKIVIIP